ncbi:MAG TPA: hypothetical protein VMB47_18035 [Candidatus Aquilonibacter sp.]|nr:hypothetical protein [Candidatus Aquilonibacter sp.]
MKMKATASKVEAGMTGLNMFGLFAVSVMVVSYALESRHSVFVLVFAASCVLASVYGFLQGAWPFGIVEAIWSVVAARRWWSGGPAHGAVSGPIAPAAGNRERQL